MNYKKQVVRMEMVWKLGGWGKWPILSIAVLVFIETKFLARHTHIYTYTHRREKEEVWRDKERKRWIKSHCTILVGF